MPILGTQASQFAGKPFITGSFESISTVTVGSGGSANVEFTSIPSTYAHLQIRAIVRKSDAGDYFTLLRFNGTGNNTFQYATHYLIGTGSAAVSGANAPSVTDAFTLVGSSSSNTSGVFSAGVIDILDYTSVNKYKTVRTLSGVDNDGSGQVDFTSGIWMNTSSVSSITLLPNGTGFARYSQFALYGIKG